MTDSNTVKPAGLRGFWCLFAAQCQEAFNDNLQKFLVIFLITSTLSTGRRDELISLALALFSVPFVLFSMAGGYLADRYSKRSVAIGVKTFELGIMSLALVGFTLGNIPILLTCICLMGTHSAFFGPAKYGALPELLPEKKLSWGNGWFGLGTFVAIILGGVVAGVLHKYLGEKRYIAGIILLTLSISGWVTSLGITRLPAANPQKKFKVNFLGDLWLNMKIAGRDRVLALAIVGSTYFWFLGALFGESTILVYSQDLLHLNEEQISYVRACLAIGIGLGSAVAGIVSGRKIEYGLIPLGAFGMALCSALMAVPGLSAVHVAVILGVLGFSGGFFMVPVNALIQHRPDHKDKGSIIAANAWLSSVGIFLAAGAFWLLKTAMGLQPTTIFLLGAFTTLAGTIYAVWLVPDSLIRLVLWGLTHSLYRVRVLGRDNIPEKGGALFVCNHASWVDALLLIASTDRHVRFMMYKQGYEKPWVKPFARILGVIPISSEQRPREMIKSLQTASEALKSGQIVCIFAEGQITRIGQLLPFRRGMERIMKGVDVPIVPVAIDGIWGSIFSFQQGRFVWKWPRRIPYPVTVSFGAPMPAQTVAFDVRQQVQELLAEAWGHRREHLQPLQRAFIRTARRHPFRFAMVDAQSPKISFGAALTKSVFLARRLKSTWAGQEMVGLLLPPSAGGALVNYAAMLMGKVPVNLNYTVSAETLAACIKQCDIKTVVTSKAFLEKLKLTVPCQTIFMEDIAGNPGIGEKLVAFLVAWLLPAGLLERAVGRGKKVQLDDLATVIFSSGSTGEPKGVMLSHYNIAANVEQMEQVLGLGARDRVLGILPFFHSFGFTGTLAMPAMVGVGAVYHNNPLDAKTIGPMVQGNAVTFLLATPTFLQFYLRACAAESFGSLRVVMTGAEKLPDRLAAAFEEHFGIRPLEGYGCTECAPAVAVNTPDFRAAGFRQVGAKRGKIGHPLPGVSVRIIDPETLLPQPLGQPGMLLVRGPNIMKGYLGKPEKTAEVLRDGWYTTGDVAALDEDGFLQITDRLSRFSKIGGEMVPHIKVEEKLHEVVGATEQMFVVTGVPDEKKGERLMVLHKLSNEKLQACLEQLVQCDLPNLWKPKADAFARVEAFPYLGTGKLDLRQVKTLAGQLALQRPSSLAETAPVETRSG